MTTPVFEEKVRALLPPPVLTEPGPQPMSLDDTMNKIAVEYADALGLLGKI